VSKYASQTTVSQERSRAEIESILWRYGASRFAYGWQGNSAMIAFEANRRRIRFILPFPTDTPRTPKGRRPLHPDKALDQEGRRRWRALVLAIKAKLEMVDSGIATFEDEFLAYTVLPNGSTVGEWITPQIESACNFGKMPPLLPMPGGNDAP